MRQSTKINGVTGLRHELEIKCELTARREQLKNTSMNDTGYPALCGMVCILEWCLQDYLIIGGD